MSSLLKVLLTAGAVGVIIAIAYYVLFVIGVFKMYEKMGEPGWKAIIPIYNGYVLMKHTWSTTAFWIMLALAVVYGIVSKGDSTVMQFLTIVFGLGLTVFQVISANKQAKSFGYGMGMTPLLFFIGAIGTMVLGFGDCSYLGNTTPDDSFM